MDSISGKGQRQALQSVLMQLSRNQLDVRFVEPALKDMQINWSASEEPLEIILSRLGRQYQIDLSLNRSAHTLYVAIDNGQCTPHREQSLSEISRVWRALGIDKRPQLPPSLVIPVDSAGYSQRLC
ncbi:hypothetical protein [Aliagarivorans taiwanensis]|uniref:hypothetical protein n=1 Tax=Aliagarivorans taiwanensis TaxID=561966 RepID=UPI00047DBD36|nr:hypothetical protein [Aliagarivorans taiwanensis]